MAETVEGAEGKAEDLPFGEAFLVRMLDAATAVLNAAGTLLIVAVMLAINADVLSRALFNAPISGVPELVAMSIVAIVFLQVPHALRLGGLTRAGILIESLPPRLRAGLEVIYCLLAVGLCIVLFNGLMPLFERAYTRNTFVGAIGDFTAPIWPVRLVMLVGTVALGLQFLMRAGRAALFAAGLGSIEEARP
ncbi:MULTISPECIES: TRAP transporter small permease subunit [unclassified Chelatococcus]|uniref:TRAP transporter small permease subunit n=1 Tax=unclassified Chelatococcus TaxID=2638111 RepID=UPI0002E6C5C8|nr:MULTISPECIES: TRAP transporter small permease [unclassified Chelatococcus]